MRCMGSEFQTLRYFNDITWDRRYGNTVHGNYVEIELDVNCCSLPVTTIKPVKIVVKANRANLIT